MINRIALWLSTAFWLLMMALLFKVDILPDYIIEDDPGYETVVRGIDTPVVRTMAVMQGDVEVGTSQTVIQPQPDGNYWLANVTTLKVKVGFIESKVSAVLNVSLDKDSQLEELFLTVDLGSGQRAELEGRRNGDLLEINATVAGEVFRESVPYDNAVVASYFNVFPMGARLKTGQRWRTKFLDPLSQKARSVEVRVVGRETIEVAVRPGEPPTKFDTYKVVTDWDGTELAAWATPDGVVVKEETPLGYTLVYREETEDDPSRGRVQVLRRKVRRP